MMVYNVLRETAITLATVKLPPKQNHNEFKKNSTEFISLTTNRDSFVILSLLRLSYIDSQGRSAFLAKYLTCLSH